MTSSEKREQFFGKHFVYIMRESTELVVVRSSIYALPMYNIFAPCAGWCQAVYFTNREFVKVFENQISYTFAQRPIVNKSINHWKFCSIPHQCTLLPVQFLNQFATVSLKIALFMYLLIRPYCLKMLVWAFQDVSCCNQGVFVCLKISCMAYFDGCIIHGSIQLVHWWQTN